MKKEEIKIWWEGPFNIEDITNGTIDSFQYDVKSNSKGIYQIYGSHPLYGNDVLVYIGRTQDKNGFKSRLSGRWVIENGNDPKNVKIYLGTIFSDTKNISDNIENSKIRKAEVLLINAMKPAFNSSNIQSVKNPSEEYILYNNGSYRNLYPILESNYFWQGFKNFILVDELAKEFSKKAHEEKNEYYGIEIKSNNNYNIWLGVDYEIWNEKGIPLTLQIYSEDNNIMNKIIDKNISNKYEYKDDDITTYISIDVNYSTKDIKEKIKSIVKQLKI